MAQHEVEVDGKNYTITCIEAGTSIWIASGFFNGKKVQQKGDSEAIAIHNWVSFAVFMHS